MFYLLFLKMVHEFQHITKVNHEKVFDMLIDGKTNIWEDMWQDKCQETSV